MLAFAGGCKRIKYDKTVDYIPAYATSSEGLGLANVKHQHAITALQAGDFEKAEKICKQILSSHNSFAPAHNTLGTIYFQQCKYYPAAWEFEYSRRAMPHRPEPHNNLGLIYERVQQYPEALGHYARAMEMEPANPEYLGNWVRLRIKQGDRSPDVEHALHALLEIETRCEWAEWARRQLAIGKFDSDCFVPKAWPIENPLPCSNCESLLIQSDAGQHQTPKIYHSNDQSPPSTASPSVLHPNESDFLETVEPREQRTEELPLETDPKRQIPPGSTWPNGLPFQEFKFSD